MQTVTVRQTDRQTNRGECSGGEVQYELTLYGNQLHTLVYHPVASSSPVNSGRETKGGGGEERTDQGEREEKET